ncbi:GatB/YqeY domain-containing protein [Niveibacterium sp.]|uniref:GatB/YqeY domain-containing protein n=1 Tax=Niveibacterium sp. TaxID=2017444 RepID=UPI0035B0D570
MSLKLQINEDMKSAMRAKETARLGALRLLLAAIKQREVDERIELDDAAVLAVIEKQVKQRRDSVAQYEQAKREDLASAERFEIEVLSAYMPAQMSADEIDAAIDAAIAETGAAGIGKLMGPLKTKLAGRADMSLVSARVKAKLSA